MAPACLQIRLTNLTGGSGPGLAFALMSLLPAAPAILGSEFYNFISLAPACSIIASMTLEPRPESGCSSQAFTKQARPTATRVRRAGWYRHSARPRHRVRARVEYSMDAHTQGSFIHPRDVLS